MGSRSPLVAAFLSFFIAGLGQLYLGYYRRGFILFMLELTTAFFAIKYSMVSGQVLNLAVSVWAAIDAYRIGKMLRVKDTKKKPVPGNTGIRVY